MKVYLHLEGDISYTVAQSISDATSVTELLTEFASSFNFNSQTSKLAATDLIIKNVEGKHLTDKKKTLYSQLSAGDDVFVIVEPSSVGCVVQPVEIINLSSRELEDGNLVDEMDNLDVGEENSSPIKSTKSKARAKAKARAKLKANAKISDAQKQELGRLVQSKSYKRARELAESVLRDVSSKDEYSIRVLSDVLFQSRAYDRAIEVCRQAVQILPKSVQILYNLTKSLMASKKFKEAIISVQMAVQAHDNPSASLYEPAYMLSEAFKMELIALRAECVFALGRHNEAVALINDVAANPASAMSVPVLIAYASFALQYNKYEEPTRALLKAVIMGENPRVQELLAKLMSTEAGMKEIMKQVPPSSKLSDIDRKGKGEVYAFLGYVAKCHSAIQASLQFYHLALAMQPSSTSCALNLVHVYEIAADYNGAMTVATEFFRMNPQLGLGQDPAACLKGPPAVLCCAEMQRLLNFDLKKSYQDGNKPPAFYWVPFDESSGYIKFGKEPLPGEAVPHNPDLDIRVRYTNAELDLLALFVTVVKILFLQGKLHLMPVMLAVMESFRLQSVVPLHETTIRNEMAYIQEITQLMCYRRAHASYGLGSLTPDSRIGLFDLYPLLSVNRDRTGAANKAFTAPSSSALAVPSMVQEAAMKPIYLLGDSHCVSPAWSIVMVRGEPRLLVPRLATGVKQWHLRAESDFYPKEHLRCMAASIPAGSEVILNIGEIDCREGILTAVERDYYVNFDEAVQHTLREFLPVLKGLVSVHKLKVFVHPIPPVLDVTRAMVIRYNAFYKQAIAGIKGVHWLDFFDELLDTRATGDPLDPVAATLKPEFKLDGTHMNPSYLRLLETSLNRLPLDAK